MGLKLSLVRAREPFFWFVRTKKRSRKKKYIVKLLRILIQVKPRCRRFESGQARFTYILKSLHMIWVRCNYFFCESINIFLGCYSANNTVHSFPIFDNSIWF